MREELRAAVGLEVQRRVLAQVLLLLLLDVRGAAGAAAAAAGRRSGWQRLGRADPPALVAVSAGRDADGRLVVPWFVAPVHAQLLHTHPAVRRRYYRCRCCCCLLGVRGLP